MQNQNLSASVNDRIRDILIGLMDTLAGLESVFLVDLETAGVLSSFPQEESKNTEFIGIILGTNIIKFESHSREIAQRSMFVKEMEMQIDDGTQIYVNRIERSILLCLVGNKEFKSGFAKRLCEGPVREDILSVLEKMGLQIGRR